MSEPASVEVVMIRAYVNGGAAQVDTLVRRLRTWGRLRGVTVLAGVQGFGQSGGDAGPLVIELFEAPARAPAVVEVLGTIAGVRHVIHWPARARPQDLAEE